MSAVTTPAETPRLSQAATRTIAWALALARYPDAGWATVLLAFGTSLIVAWSVASAHWVPRIPLFFVAALSGGLMGLVVAQSRRSIVLPHVAAIALGLGQSAAHTLLLVPGSSLEGKLLTGGYRVVLWAQALLEGGASTDKLAFVLALVFAVWFLCYLTVFLVLRFLSIWALLPGGFALFSNLTYLPPKALSWLLLYLLVAGLLLVRLTYLERARTWRASGAAPTPWLALHTLHAGLWFAVAVFFLTTFLPTLRPGPSQIRNAWAEVRAPLGDMESTFTRVFASLPARRSLSMYGFGAELPFRGNISLSDDVVMLVQSDVPLYWRARTYETYQRWGWVNGPLIERKLGSLQDLAGNPPATCAECVHGFTVEVRVPTTTVYSAGTPLRTSLPVEARYLSTEGPSGERLVKLEARRVMQSHQRYTVQVSVPRVTAESLQQERAPYPPWIAGRYTALPNTVTPRVRELARQLTSDVNTPYEKAVRVRDHLRGYTYSQDIQAPPPGADSIDYFLFVQKAGYSDYFGSAMVVLLRAAGVPARLAVGYITGDLDPESSAFVVRESDAHAWAEVYFPNVGWVPFEPTPSQPLVVPGGPIDIVPIAAPLGLARSASGDLTGFFWEDESAFQTGTFEFVPDDLPEGRGIDFSTPIAAIRILFMAAGFLAVVLLVSVALLVWRRGLARPRTPSQAYSQMARLGSLAGLRRRPDETPQEYATRLSEAAPEANGALLTIAETYGRATYGPKTALAPVSPAPETWNVAARRLLGLAFRRATRGRQRVNGRARRLAYEA